MSVSALNWVLGERRAGGAPGLVGPKHTNRLVLISLANFANDDGQCWPAIDSICMQANVTERAAKDALRWLEEGGYVTIVVNGAPDERVRKDRRTNLYSLSLGPERGYESRQAQPHGGTNRVSTGVRIASKSVRETTPEAIEEASVNLLEESTPSGLDSEGKPGKGWDPVAREMVSAWWEWWQSDHPGTAPTTTPFPGVVSAVTAVAKTGRFRAGEIKAALVSIAQRCGAVSKDSLIREIGNGKPRGPRQIEARQTTSLEAEMLRLDGEAW